ncbi:MAG: glycosyltransferase family 2 protein [Rikenellaceae bacterium]
MDTISTQPIVSILVPVYGVERYVEQCVRSLMEQSYEACRYIFVDDCSPDRSVDIIRSTVAEYPHREGEVRIVSHDQNRGVGATRNTLLECAEGEYIVWVDSDDWVDERFVESMVTRCIVSTAEVLKCGRVEVYGDGDERVNLLGWLSTPRATLKGVLGQSHLIANNIHGVMVSLEMIHRHGICFAPRVDMGEDYTFVSQILYHAKSLTNVYKPLYYYRAQREGSYMDSITKRHIDSYVRANVWVTQYIMSQREGASFKGDLGVGKVNIKKWIGRRGVCPSSYNEEIFGGDKEEWLRGFMLRIYNRIVDINNISLTKIFAAIITMPLIVAVEKAKMGLKRDIKRENMWG